MKGLRAEEERSDMKGLRAEEERSDKRKEVIRGKPKQSTGRYGGRPDLLKHFSSEAEDCRGKKCYARAKD